MYHDSGYSSRLASTRDDVENALQLRNEVFYRELGRQFRPASGADRDEYDEQCDHLIVEARDSGRVVATYRVQTFEQATQGSGFVAASIFDLEGLPPRVLRAGVEAGRACVAKDHRNGAALMVLLRGLARYLRASEKRYLFGYVGIPVKDARDAVAYYRRLEETGGIHPDYHVRARQPHRCVGQARSATTSVVASATATMLLDMYQRLGGTVCSEPAYHERLGLVQVLVLLDTRELAPVGRRLAFRPTK